MQNNFWQNLDQLILDSEIIIDRTKGSAHPRFPEMIYPCDYGYLNGTTSNDGNEIDVWRGCHSSSNLTAIICTVDNLKKDCEIKLLIGCSEEETNTILSFHNNSEFMSGILIRRYD
ncbi:MAG: inorganic pyrophosphatase [Ignavibacteriales bacterium]|nr:inorganic pyrophosphatase [Ignavibacteriales bacterium]